MVMALPRGPVQFRSWERWYCPGSVMVMPQLLMNVTAALAWLASRAEKQRANRARLNMGDSSLSILKGTDYISRRDEVKGQGCQYRQPQASPTPSQPSGGKMRLLSSR